MNRNSLSLGKRLKALGHNIFYLVMRLFGHRGGMALLHFVVLVYVTFSAGIHRATRPYFRRRFPDHGPFALWLDTFRNIMSFGRVLVDRGWLGVNPEAELKGCFTGYGKIKELMDQGKGAVLMLAHVGNWQTALAGLEEMPVKVHALMQYDMQEVSKHYFDLRGGGCPFHIISTDSEFGGMIEAATALGKGEFVTVMGDRFVKGPAAEVEFLGDTARFPASSYMLAACAGVPVVILFAARIGDREYELRVMDMFRPEYRGRDERQAMLLESAGKFSSALEKYLSIYPYQWYNFYDFWKK
jgi:predicted LPLAT superfamily acyltransferase